MHDLATLLPVIIIPLCSSPLARNASTWPPAAAPIELPPPGLNNRVDALMIIYFDTGTANDRGWLTSWMIFLSASFKLILDR